MTLNGHFALKSVSGSATNGFACPAFGQNCSKICRAIPIYCQQQKCSPGTYSFLQYKVYADIRVGSLERERQMRVLSIGENGDFRFFRSLSSEHFYQRVSIASYASAGIARKGMSVHPSVCLSM